MLLYPILSSQKITLSIIEYNFTISQDPNFYFTIQYIKIIFLHNKIIYPKTQIKTKTQITSTTTCYHHHHEEHTQTETHGHTTTLQQKSKQMKPTSATMKPTFTTTTRDTATTTTHPPPPCKQTHKKSKKNPFKFWYYLTSKHQKGPLPDLLLVKKFTIVLLYCSSIVKIKIIHFILSFSFP